MRLKFMHKFFSVFFKACDEFLIFLVIWIEFHASIMTIKFTNIFFVLQQKRKGIQNENFKL